MNHTKGLRTLLLSSGIWLFVCVLTAPSFSADQRRTGDSATWKSLQEQGDEQLKRNNYPEALGSYQSALSTAQKDSDPARQSLTLFQLGRCRFRMGDNTGAQKYFQESIAMQLQSVDNVPPKIPSDPAADVSPYIDYLSERIYRHWVPPKGTESERISVSFKIQKKGQLSHLVLITGRRIQKADDAALKAVELSAPFSPLPDGVGGEVDVNFRFEQKASRRRGEYLLANNPLADENISKLRRDEEKLAYLRENTELYKESVRRNKLPLQPLIDSDFVSIVGQSIRNRLHPLPFQMLPAVRLIVTRDGAHYYSDIQKSSGNQLIDDEVLAMLSGERFPPPPAGKALIYPFLFDPNELERHSQ